ncbi:MAG TPA: BTAD domain-containing putative transcriptional regulator [Anaerolineales bacterium]
MLKVRLLGQYDVRLDGQPVEIASRPAQALLAFLILNAGTAERREKLAALFWPESDEANARSYLRHALWRLRKSLGENEGNDRDFFIAGDINIAFDASANYWLDATALEKKEDESWGIEAYLEAVSVYRGDLLPGFDAEWITLERERLHTIFQRKMQALMDLLEQAGKWSDVLEWGERWIALGRMPEPAFRALMRAYYAQGDLANVASVYQRCVNALRQDLDVEPSEQTRNLYARLSKGEFPLEKLAPEIEEVEKHPAPGEPPYKGLQHFDEEDAELFFGREALIAKLVSRLSALTSSTEGKNGERFLAVIGASGSGKSSLLRAGLISALRAGQPLFDGTLPPAGSTGWEIRLLTPSAHPLEALATCLTQQADSVRVTANLINDLAVESNALHLFARKILSPGSRGTLLLIIDQFEELFTLCRSEAERGAFVDNLMVAAEMDGPVFVIIALRSDFYAHCGAYSALRDALQARQMYLGRMSPDELRRAVTGPADLHGWGFEPGLVDYLLREVKDEPGGLPLLSHALLETWQRRRGRTLTFTGYRESGGVHGAVARTAERVFQELDADQKAAAKNIFLRLTEPGEDRGEGLIAPDTRRQASLDELTPQTRDGRVLNEVLQRLVEARLVTISEDKVEVAHEVLIREWPTLRGWLDENREALQAHRHLTKSARAWESMGRDAGELYRGARLTQAIEWAEQHQDEMNPLERQFLQASMEMAQQREAEREAQRQRELEAAQKLAAEQELRADEQARTSRRFRWVSLWLGVLLLITAGLGLLALRQTNRVTEQARLATSRELAAEAISNLEVDPDRSILLALSAVSGVQSRGLPVPRQAEEALHRAVQASRVTLTLPGALGVDFSPDGARLATSGPDSTAKILDAANGQELLTLAGHSGDLFGVDVSFSPDGQRLVTASADGTAKVWDARTGDEIVTLRGHSATVFNAVFSPDGTRVATSSADGTVRVWAAGTGRQLAFIEQPYAAGIAFNPQGTRLAVGADDVFGGSVSIWDPVSGQKTLTLTGQGGATGVDFSPDGERLAVAGTDGRIRIWDVMGDRELLTLAVIAPIRSVAFSPDGSQLATGGAHGVAMVWEVASGDLVVSLSGHTGTIWNLDFSPDGSYLATADTGGTTRVWDITPEGSREWLTLAGHTSVVFSVDFSSDGKRLATSSWDNSAIVWDASSGERLLTLTDFGAQVARFTFSPDDTKLAAADYSGTVSVWDAADGKRLISIEAHSPGDIDVAFSPDGTRLASGGLDGLVKLWDAATGEQLASFSGHEDLVQRLAFSPDGTLLATASLDGTARVWDISSHHEMYTLSAEAGRVWNLDFNPDGAYLATAHDDGNARVWDLTGIAAGQTGEGREVLSLTGHSGSILDAAFSPDGRHIATLSFDSTARLWDATSGQELIVLGRNDNGADLDFSPDGRFLATTNGDGQARIYVLQVEELMELARSRLTRSWRLEECRRYLRQEACPLE